MTGSPSGGRCISCRAEIDGERQDLLAGRLAAVHLLAVVLDRRHDLVGRPSRLPAAHARDFLHPAPLSRPAEPATPSPGGPCLATLLLMVIRHFSVVPCRPGVS